MAKKLVIKDKDNEIIYPQTLSNLVYNEITGNTVKEDLENVGSNLLQLSETDGAANKATLNAALSQGDVKLKKGTYPLDNGVVVNDVILDLNGSCLQSTKTKVTTGLIIMKGKKPVVRNGELCANFTDPSYNPSPTSGDWYEGESLIRLQLYEDALIEGVELHNCWGYAIGVKEPGWRDLGGDTDNKQVAVRETIDYTKVTAVDSPSSEILEFLTNVIDIPENFSYICATGIDYNYICSCREIEYTFYNNNTKINTTTAIPGIILDIPENANKVTIKFFRYNVSDEDRAEAVEDYQTEIAALFKRVHVRFFNTKVQCLTVKDCCMHNNHSLGMVGMPYGITKVLNCRSYEQGKPTKFATQNTNTCGFIDIEDKATPIFIMDKCTSEDEPNFAMIGAFRSTITNCYGDVTIYRGWSANISNCVGCMSSGLGSTENYWYVSQSPTVVNVSNCVITRKNTVSTNWIGSNNTYIDCYPCDVTKENNFIIRKLHKATDTYVMPLSGLIRGKMYNPCSTTGNAGIRNISTKKGSDFTYIFSLVRKPNETQASYNNRVRQYGASPVAGDCYGITSNMPFYPNGHTIYDSTFTPRNSYGGHNNNAGTYVDGDNWWTGEYANCTFNLNSGSMFNDLNKKLLSSDRTLVFRNCIINNTNNYLFQVNMTNLSGKNYKILFINCTIADQNKLFKVTPTDFTYEIITEDLDYDSRIKALEERIRQLEENS